jgi:hypothetical protein
VLVLDSGAVSRLARRTRQNAALIAVLRREGLWPPIVPSVVLVESVTGRATDANVNRLLKTCDVVTELSERDARRAALVRAKARRGSAVDAVVVVMAEPGGVVLTTDPVDLAALAAYSNDVTVETV